ncbi:MAG: hypothetical protein ABIG44_14260 [Planctomycetota bacterium]
MARRLIVVVVIGLLAANVLAQSGQAQSNAPRPYTPTTLRLLNQRIPEVTFDQVPFESVMDWVKELTGANVVVRWEMLEQMGIERDKPITIKVKNLRLSQVLWMVMNEAGGSDVKLAYRAAGTLLILSTEEDLSRELVLKVYDVGDLLTSAPRFTNAAQLDPGQALNQQGQGGQGGGGGGGSQLFQTGQNNDNNEDDTVGGADIDTLIQLITDTVEPDSWTVNGGIGQIYPYRSSIVVYNTLLVHQRIGGYVEDTVLGP